MAAFNGPNSWAQVDRLVPIESLVYNDSRWAPCPDGGPVEYMLTLSEREAPRGIRHTYGAQSRASVPEVQGRVALARCGSVPPREALVVAMVLLRAVDAHPSER